MRGRISIPFLVATFVVATPGGGGDGTIAQAQQPKSAPNTAPVPRSQPDSTAGDVLKPVADWFERANREYQGTVVKELSVPTGKQPDGPSKANAASTPTVVDRVRGWLGMEPAKAPPTARPSPESNDAKAVADEMVRRQVEARREEQLRAAEDERIAADMRKAKEATDLATQQRQKAAETARAEDERRKSGKPDEQRADAAKDAAANVDKDKDAAEKDRKAKLAAAEEAKKDLLESERKSRQAAYDKIAADKLAAEKDAADKAAAEKERKAKVAADKAAADKAAAEKETTERAAEKERKAKVAADKAAADTAAAEKQAAQKAASDAERRARIEIEKATAERTAQAERTAREERDARAAKSKQDTKTAAETDTPKAAKEKSDRDGKDQAARMAAAASRAADQALDKQKAASSGSKSSGSKMAALSTARVDGDRPRKNTCSRAGSHVDVPGTYTVKSGDSLWSISRRHYDKGQRYRKIVRANEAKLASPDLIYPCQKFFLPASVIPVEAEPVDNDVATMDAAS